MNRARLLYETVERYAAFGNHRTGTLADAITIDWLADRLRKAGAAVDVQSWTFPRDDASWEFPVVGGASANVIATLGDGSAGTLLIGTPTSGWFRCAGERGTGIAIALEVAGVLAEEGVAITLVATSGHEIGAAGAQHYLANNSVSAAAVLHVGASIAVRRPAPADRTPTDRVWLRTTEGALTAGTFPDDWDVQQVIDAGDPSNWLGEAKNWSSLGVPLLSMAGMFPQFHTPDDLPDVVTSPELLDSICDLVLDLARRHVR